MKFKALISFSHDVSMFDPGKDYEHENVELVEAWEKAGYVEVKKHVTQKIKVEIDGKKIAEEVIKEVKKETKKKAAK